jgi:diguanylate cyclase (GGDEF)-like protein
MNLEIAKLLTPAWLGACPFGLAVLANDRPVWVNAALEGMLGQGAGDLRQQAPEHPLWTALLRGQGPVQPPGTGAWLSGRRAEVATAEGGRVQLLFVQEVTEAVRLEAQCDELARRVEELTLTDPLTGLANRRALGHTLSAQVTRSRRYHNPLCIALVQVRVPGPAGSLPDASVLSVSRFLRDRLRWVDAIGRYEEDLFLLILPETGLDAARGLLQAVREEAERDEYPGVPGDLRPSLRLGVAEWRRGQDAARLVEQARRQLAQEGAVPATAR